MLENIIIGLGGWLGGIATTFLLRWARKDHISEGLSRMETALKLKKQMSEAGVSAEEINALLANVAGRQKKKEERVAMGFANPNPEVVKENMEREELAELSAAITQAEMNVASGRYLERVDLTMRQAYDRLEESLTDEEQIRRLQEAQQSWEEYRRASGTMIAKREGTIWPMVAALAMARLTKRRIDDLIVEREVFEEGNDSIS